MPDQAFGANIVTSAVDIINREKSVEPQRSTAAKSPDMLTTAIICEHSGDSRHPSTVSAAKRLIDIVGSIVGLLITAVIAIPLAIAIWIDNPGPIFYSQLRCGLNGSCFRIWKFRSMVRDAERLKSLVPNQAKGLIFKNEDDPRITRVGRFIRRTSLDEFPQFWNVLRGDMSLVGTRPPTLDEVLAYEPHHWERLRVKPGLTGEWQVRGRSDVKDFEDVVRLDLTYQQRWSPLYDGELILRTLTALLSRRSGAY